MLKLRTKDELMNKYKVNNFDLFQCATEHESNDFEISVNEYIEKKQKHLEESINQLKKVYLDTNFWIQLRDREKFKNKTFQVLYELLKRGVQEKKIICPFSSAIYFELMLQSDDKTRMQTAHIIDELSDGIAIKDFDSLMYNDFYNFLEKYNNEKTLFKSDFDYVGNVTGVLIPQPKFSIKNLSESSIQKAWYDSTKFWTAEFITTKYHKEESIEYNKMRVRIANYVNNEVRTHHENDSQKQILQNELIGSLDPYKEMIITAFHERYQKLYPTAPAVTVEELIKNKETIFSFFCRTLIARKKNSNDLSTAYIFSVLNTLNIIDKKREIESHDSDDFKHASVALRTCDYFFTENRLRNQLSLGPYNLDKKFSVKVISKVETAIELIKEVVSK